MTSDTPRRNDRNYGVFVDPQIPDDRHIVAGIVILLDDEGRFSAYSAPSAAGKNIPMPSDEMLLDITNMLADAWSIASLITTEEREN